ncbi:alpha/beta fold hydrolase [Sporichthya brevicatena]|uniref:Alpha/beta fold hydrolase n=1 Tax=Sporichthya brevicatena TaxID=171442 RepID=A0ABN1GUJ8_9ACTN
MAYADINGQRIFYTDSGGDGPPVVFSHGFLMDSSMFAPQVAALAGEFRVITWDARGFGATEFDEKPFTYWDNASDVLALCDHLGIERAVFAGMSQGGFASLRVALLAPERRRGLILIDTQAGAENPDKVDLYADLIEAWATVGPGDDLANIVAGIILDDPDLNRQWIARWQSRPHETIREPGRCLLERESLVDRLGDITCPALVIHGDNDSAIELERAEEMSARLSGSDGVVVVRGGAHAANLTHPEPVNAAILKFLRSLS